MSSNFNQALNIIRKKSSNTVEQGFAFEKLSKIYFENDDIQTQEYKKIWHYKDWAKENPSFSKIDIGIDLIGELKNEKGLAAIQCKFFKSEYQITKDDLDSFVSASSNIIFTRLILIDTSNQDLSANAKSMIYNLDKTYQRIQKYDLENTRIDWLEFIENEKIILSKKKDPLDHQLKAISEAKKHYLLNERGKMIMACGTGKTYTSLKIAEEIDNTKFVLYMVPSLVLMSQSIREWKNDCAEDFIAFSACSDKRVGKVKNDSDQIQIKLNELAIPATTDSKMLADEVTKIISKKMIVVFSTYQSIDVISNAQKKYSMKSFDLIICDEAHRTTGATFEGEEDSHFVKIHDDEYVQSAKRLYMTATPRIFGNKAKQKADSGRVELASMDDPEKFGKEFFNRGFNWAVENNLLSDYKVVILAIDENLVSANLQKSLEEGNELKLTDATKIIGVYKALAKVGFNTKEGEKLKPIKKALAFSQSIAISKIFEKEFTNVINEYVKNEDINDKNKVDLSVEVKHVDGTFNADQRNENLNWLKNNTEKNTCRILSNVKCLSEGVDVPTLDAIMFLHPKKSQIDVVQAVGRVMRKAEDKDLGYVIIPVTVAPGVSPEKALNDNEKYKVVWQIVNALRTHDERLDSKINMLGLGEDVSDKIEIIPLSAEQDATTAKVEDVAKKGEKKDETDEIININDENKEEEKVDNNNDQMSFELNDLSQAIKAKIVEKCGTRDYWENWADDISKLAKKYTQKINSIVINSKSNEKKYFDEFLKELQDDLNPEVSESDAIEMLAQHIITKPVFESLFDGNKFSKENSISIALEKVLVKINIEKITNKDNSLERFYDSVKRRSQDIVSIKAKTTLINELYERFFKNAFPTTTSKLGIVYTPVEIVDFIINSTNEILVDEFGKSFNDKNIHILDPFTGTGTFITHLLQSGLIKKENIPYKYKNEIHANEIVLLAYYIAGINIEAVYHEITRENSYESFKGIILTDTFQLYEQERDMVANLLPDNSNKRMRQKKLNIQVIIGNPPYSAKQSSVNDDAANVKYPNLDNKIEKTYVNSSTANNKNILYDSYIRAFRWASDRLDNGVIGFVTGAGWIDRSFADGLRKNFYEEFSSIYIVNLRGDIRKNILSSGEAGEGENVFGQGSMTGIAITFLVKNKKNNKKGIFYYDIGNNKTRKEKLNLLKKFENIQSIKKQNKFITTIPDEYNDWINKGDKSFKKYIKIGDKKNKNEIKIFKNYSQGVGTSRDFWSYNFSSHKLKKNINYLIDNYNKEVKNKKSFQQVLKSEKLIKWSSSLQKHFEDKKYIKNNPQIYSNVHYRPFQKTNLCMEPLLIHRISKIKDIFPTNKIKNLTIGVTGVGSRSGFSTFMTDTIPDIQFKTNGQFFPRKLYSSNLEDGLFANQNNQGNNEIDAITDISLDHFKKFYENKKITKDDIFFYIYGLFHSKEYFIKFKNNLIKELPRIPLIKNFQNFKIFCNTGKKLSEMHVNYDLAKLYPVKIVFTKDNINIKLNPKKLYYVQKMKFSKKNSNNDKKTIIYNENISINDIPLEAYNYKLNGKSAIELVMDKQCVSTNSDTGFINDANDYANDFIKNPAYPLELIQKVITISIESQKLINNLPKLEIN